MAHDPDEIEAAARARVGQVLSGKWTLERLLGMGGMAAVYGGRHRNGAKAAVKVLHPELARHKDIRERFLREGYAANRVEHPGAVAVLDDDVVQGGPDDGAAYIVMELLDGESLDARAARKPLDERELLMVADGILEVLEAAHARGVVHRDLKPDNLFVLRSPSDEGALKVKVLDFGLARMQLPDEARSVTRHGVTIGTPAYMSPEQAAGRADEIDGRADLFSVGAVMFRLRTGKRIHDAAHPIELVAKMAKLPAPPIRSVDPSVSEDFAAIVDRALAFERHARYPDAASMRADVRAALDRRAPVKVAPPPPPPVTIGHDQTELARYDRSSFASLAARKSSFPLFGVLFLLLAGGGVWFVLHSGHIPGLSGTNEEVPSSPSASASAASDDATAPEDAGTDGALLALPVEPLDDADVDADADLEEDDDDDDDAGADAAADAAPEDASEADGGAADTAPLAVAPKSTASAKPATTAKPKTSTTKKPTTTTKKKKKRKKK